MDDGYYVDALGIALLGGLQQWYSGGMTGGATLPWPFQEGHGSAARKATRYVNALRAWRALPGAERVAAAAPEPEPSRSFAMDMLTMATGRPFRNLDATDTYRAAARIVLRLEAFHDRRGRWPDGLEEAMDERETRDPITDGAFGYQRLDADPVGRAYVLMIPSEAKHMREDEQARREIIDAGGAAPARMLDFRRSAPVERMPVREYPPRPQNRESRQVE